MKSAFMNTLHVNGWAKGKGISIVLNGVGLAVVQDKSDLHPDLTRT